MIDDAPDAALLALLSDWEEAAELEDCADRELQRVQRELFESIDPVPADLLVKGDDDTLLRWAHVTSEPCRHRGGEGKSWYGANDAMMTLSRALIRAKEVGGRDEFIKRVVFRLESILKAGRIWLGHRALMEGKAGLLDAERQHLLAEAACSNLRRQIAVIRPQTMAGLQGKVKMAIWTYGVDAQGMEHVLRQRVQGEIPYGPTGPTLAEILAFDLHGLANDAHREAGLHLS